MVAGSDRPLSPNTNTFGRSPSFPNTDIFGRSPFISLHPYLSAIAPYLPTPTPLGDRPPDTFWDVAH
ncbi:hypothetical protein HNI00_05305 [Thermoleptolyngbya oregonensis NK1-22]|uniref:Uncharacterized protein n=1 Tax=Thermoleptolyngbya oregonensis NK1-22 TaxID=2547457 RepID=A0AA96Y3T3_9CYAN|nr:hypothetical protein [Thermoleptolyngbya oregonensis]WOB42636.1 hypothetical protein HNI00_05305 [Thermoleptolyngbya oregonensis NK1-22]